MYIRLALRTDALAIPVGLGGSCWRSCNPQVQLLLMGKPIGCLDGSSIPYISWLKLRGLYTRSVFGGRFLRGINWVSSILNSYLLNTCINQKISSSSSAPGFLSCEYLTALRSFTDLVSGLKREKRPGWPRTAWTVMIFELHFQTGLHCIRLLLEGQRASKLFI